MGFGRKILFSQLEDLIQQAEQTSLPELMGNVERIRMILMGRMIHSSNVLNRSDGDDPPKEKYLSPEKAASLLDIPLSTIYCLVKKGQIPHVRIGKHIRIPVESIMRPDFKENLVHMDTEKG